MNHPARGIALVLASLLTVIALVGRPALAQDAATINLSHDLVRLGIAATNVTPDSPTIDSRPLFQAALTYAQSHPLNRITVDPGAYYFLTPQDTQTYLRLAQLSGVTIDLADSTFFLAQPFFRAFELVNCVNVTLTRFRTDFLNPPYTHVQLTATDPLGRSLGYAQLPGWPDPVSFNGLTTPTGSPTLWALAFRNGDIVPGTSRMPVQMPITDGVLTLEQDNAPWTQGPTLATLDPGDTIVVTVRGGFGPVAVVDSDGVTISAATVQGSSSIAVLFTSCSHSVADAVRVVPRPNTGLVAANADGIHFTSSGPDNHIRNSFVTRTVDDALAIDSQDIATVTGQPGPAQVAVDRTPLLRFPDGTQVTFVDPVSGAEKASATIVSQMPPDSATPAPQVTLTLDRPLPALSPGTGMAVAVPAARGAGSSIEANVVRDIVFGRGVWIGGAEGVAIAANDIGRTSNGGIVVSQSTNTKSFMTPPAHDVVVLDNHVHGSLGPMASGTGTQLAVGAIIVETTNTNNLFPAAAPNTNVSIEGNVVVDSGRSGIWIGELAGGTISGNVISHWDRHPELPLFGVTPQVSAQLLQDFTEPLVVHNSQNVTTFANVTTAPAN